MLKDISKKNKNFENIPITKKIPQNAPLWPCGEVTKKKKGYTEILRQD
jgi:hypothetical protein